MIGRQNKMVRKKKQTKITIRKKVESDKTVFALVENAESQLSLQEIKGKIIDKLAYSFTSKGITVDGLTFWGMKACAEGTKNGKWSPMWTKPEYQALSDGSVLLTIGCTNPITKQTEWGNCVFFPKVRFSERTALTNAKRYAIDKHISVTQKVAFVQYLKKNKPDQILKIKESSKVKTGDTFVVSNDGKVKSKHKEVVL
jgi:hypothetical protein